MGKNRRAEGKNNEKHVDEGPRFTKFEIATIILAVVAICVSIYSVHISISNSYTLANYTMQQQITFDRHGAANQLSIEINSMYESLQYYTYEFMKYYDFSQGGNNVFIDSDTNSMFRVFDENMTRLYELDVRNGVFTAKKIDGILVRNKGALTMKWPNITERDMGTQIGNNGYYIDNIVLNSFPVVVDNPIIPSPLYNDHGMYYVYETDASKFNRNLSQDLYVFYNNLIRAESDRQYIQNYLDSHPNGKLNGKYFDAYMDMRISIIYAANMAPTVLTELEKEENS